MDIIDKIESFAGDTYFKMPNELNNDYIKICEQIVAFFEENFSVDGEAINQSKVLLEYLLTVMQTGDYIKMADALLYKVKPIFEDSINVIKN